MSSTQLQVTGEEYRSAAVLLWGEAGAYACDAFARLNHDLFGNELPPLPIVLGITAYGHCLAITRYPEIGRPLPRISLAVGLFNKKGIVGVDDTLIHEMVHACLILRGEIPDHNARPWCRLITKLSPRVLGHDIIANPVRSRRVPSMSANNGYTGSKTIVVRREFPGELTRKQLAGWPHSLRPEGFNWGPTIEVPTY